MPLPSANAPWPPKHLRDAFNAYTTCQVWWEGDADKLASAHGEPEPARRSGGFMQRIRRLFWGTKTDVSQQPRALHVPVAADIVQTAASTLLPEPVAFRVADGDTVASDEARTRVDLILNSPQMHSGMLQSAEACSALGDVYGRIVWNSAIRDHAWIDWVHADQAVPEFQYGVLSALTVWRVVDEDTEKNRVLRHLERHEPGRMAIGDDGEATQVYGRIYHGLYEGTAVSLGVPISLSAHPDTAGIPVNDEGYVDTGTTRMTACHIPNALPNPAFRGRSTVQHLGRSDIGDPAVIGLMDQIDETYSSLSRDVRLAKARLLVSEFLLDMKSPGQGSTFSVEQEVYEKVGGAPSASPVLEAHQFQIRVDDHLRTAEGYLRAILRRIGFSPWTFGLSDDSGAAMTATEVDARSDASTNTQRARSGIWKARLAELGRTLIEVDAAVFGTGALIGQDLEVRWPPAARDSVQAKSQTLVALKASGSASRKWRVRYLNPDYDDEAVDDEVALLEAEESVAAVDPFSVGSDQPPDTGAESDEDAVPDENREVDEIDDEDGLVAA
ncbi:hypothetical protein [Nocardia puris]|uniref:hypothetical protein n=1 Tax=Nocardia puris TaxID=208602 RepID=UPI002E1A3E7C